MMFYTLDSKYFFENILYWMVGIFRFANIRVLIPNDFKTYFTLVWEHFVSNLTLDLKTQFIIVMIAIVTLIMIMSVGAVRRKRWQLLGGAIMYALI